MKKTLTLERIRDLQAQIDGVEGVPVGTILPFGGNTIPDGFLLCNGAEINRNTFADLFAVIGILWGSGNGSTTFRLPTTQGLFLRGRANGSGYDPDRNSRNAIQTGGATGDNVGSYQSHRYQSHSHYSYNAWSVNNLVRVNGLSVGASGNSFFNTTANRLFLGTNSEFDIRPFNGNANDNNIRGNRHITTNAGSNQTAPYNVNVNYIIKY